MPEARIDRSLPQRPIAPLDEAAREHQCDDAEGNCDNRLGRTATLANNVAKGDRSRNTRSFQLPPVRRAVGWFRFVQMHVCLDRRGILQEYLGFNRRACETVLSRRRDRGPKGSIVQLWLVVPVSLAIPDLTRVLSVDALYDAMQG